MASPSLPPPQIPPLKFLARQRLCKHFPTISVSKNKKTLRDLNPAQYILGYVWHESFLAITFTGTEN